MLATLDTKRVGLRESSCVGYSSCYSTLIRTLACATIFATLFCPIAFAVQTEQPADATSLDPQKTGGQVAEPISDAQLRISQRYRLLEDKLFTLYEFERDQNPMRSKLLKRAYQQSQEKMTATHLRTIVELLAN